MPRMKRANFVKRGGARGGGRPRKGRADEDARERAALSEDTRERAPVKFGGDSNNNTQQVHEDEFD